MSELQTRFIDDTYVEYYNTGKHDLAEIYLKSDVDKLIADLEESHKKEVEQLLMEIVDIKGRLASAEEEITEKDKQIRRQKYKRCLDKAEICCEKKENCYNRALRKYSKGEADYLVRKSEFWKDWEFRWLKIGEKFKEAK